MADFLRSNIFFSFNRLLWLWWPKSEYLASLIYWSICCLIIDDESLSRICIIVLSSRGTRFLRLLIFRTFYYSTGSSLIWIYGAYFSKRISSREGSMSILLRVSFLVLLNSFLLYIFCLASFCFRILYNIYSFFRFTKYYLKASLLQTLTTKVIILKITIARTKLTITLSIEMRSTVW